MDFNDTNSNSSIDWKNSFLKHDFEVRRVQSTPIVKFQDGRPQNVDSESNNQKKLFVSFSQEVEDGFVHKPVLFQRSFTHHKPIKRPDCTVMLCKRKFFCNAELLQEYSLLFKQLNINRNSYTPIILNSEKKIFPDSFWLLYQWINFHKSGDPSVSEFINLHWVAELYIASKYLIIQELQDACYRYLTDMEKVKEENAFFIFVGLEKYDAGNLCEYLVSLIQGSFTAIAGTQDFLDLNCDQVLQILYSQYIVVHGEIEVFYAGVRWLLDNIEERDIYIEDIMSTVRFHFMELKQLLKICREFPRITGRTPVCFMVEQAVRIAVLKDVNSDYIKEKYLSHLPEPRNSKYKPIDQQVESYREFIHLSRRRREKNSRIYHNMNRIDFPRTRFVEEMDNLYVNWKINNFSWESLKSKSTRSKMSSTYN